MSHHPSVAAILRFFSYEHLPPHLQEVSRPFCELALRRARAVLNEIGAELVA